jgi:hypothetical protein
MARLLKQQSSINVYRLPTKENTTFVFRLQKTNGSLPFPFAANNCSPFSYSSFLARARVCVCV